MAIPIDRVLESATRRAASEVWLVPGRPDWLRIHEQLRELDMPSVEPEDIDHLLDLHQGAWAPCVTHGAVDFHLRYGEGHAAFAVTVVGVGDARCAVLRLARPAVVAAS